jgi:hypothetical protein
MTHSIVEMRRMLGDFLLRKWRDFLLCLSSMVSVVLGPCRRYLAKIPSPESRQKHTNIALGLIATAVFALGPLGYSMLESHPCGA